MAVKLDHIKGLIARLIYIFHAFICTYQVYHMEKEPAFWLLLLPVAGLLAETIFTYKFSDTGEWKWISPCVFIYLFSVVPPIWIMELHLYGIRIKLDNVTSSNEPEVAVPFGPTWTRLDLKFDQNETHGKESVGNADIDRTLNAVGDVIESLHATPQDWTKVMEQMLLLFLIVGRWLLPKGSISRDQLSVLLLGNIGTAADILELFEAFNEDNVKYNIHLIVLLLSLWTVSLVQFAIVMTATKRPFKRRLTRDAEMVAKMLIDAAKREMRERREKELEEPKIVAEIEDTPPTDVSPLAKTPSPDKHQDIEFADDGEDTQPANEKNERVETSQTQTTIIDMVESPQNDDALIEEELTNTEKASTKRQRCSICCAECVDNAKGAWDWFFGTDAWSICASLCMQDIPFFVTRLCLIFIYGVVSYGNIFFTSKNGLVIMLQLYRLFALFSDKVEADRAVKQSRKEMMERNTATAPRRQGSGGSVRIRVPAAELAPEANTSSPIRRQFSNKVEPKENNKEK